MTEHARGTPAHTDLARQSAEHWTRHNVTQHRRFANATESLAYLQWRNDQYPGYIDLMPVDRATDLTVLDFGCGPGNDLVGFVHYSRPKHVIGMDVSSTSLAEARARLALHERSADLRVLDPLATRIPLEDASVDYIHCSGVIMLIPDPLVTLREFKRILRPGGELRVMAYNYDSLFLHLYVAYHIRLLAGKFAAMDIRQAFGKCTDGEDCPVCWVWTPAEFCALGTAAGFATEHLGCAVSVYELSLLPTRFDAIQDERLPAEHRQFLLQLTFDSRGIPSYRDQIAGVDGCYRLTPKQES